jgi:hypothetical protein
MTRPDALVLGHDRQGDGDGRGPVCRLDGDADDLFDRV